MKYEHIVAFDSLRHPFSVHMYYYMDCQSLLQMAATSKDVREEINEFVKPYWEKLKVEVPLIGQFNEGNHLAQGICCLSKILKNDCFSLRELVEQIILNCDKVSKVLKFLKPETLSDIPFKISQVTKIKTDVADLQFLMGLYPQLKKIIIDGKIKKSELAELKKSGYAVSLADHYHYKRNMMICILVAMALALIVIAICILASFIGPIGVAPAMIALACFVGSFISGGIATKYVINWRRQYLNNIV